MTIHELLYHAPPALSSLLWILVLLVHDADMFRNPGYDYTGWVLLALTIGIIVSITGSNFKKLHEEVCPTTITTRFPTIVALTYHFTNLPTAGHRA